jgi:fatty acid desaturase
MSEKAAPLRIQWYRSPVSRQQLSELNRRSDFKGLLQSLGFLAVLATTGTAVVLATGRTPWPVVLPLVWLHGTVAFFLINAVHELVHDSVFRTRWLNRPFLWIFSFLGWHNYTGFWASHTEHHKYTLHPPDDQEVLLPVPLSLGGFLGRAFFDPLYMWQVLRSTVRRALGIFAGDWDSRIYPPDQPQLRRRSMNWARFLLLGHATLIGVSLWMGWWMVPVVTAIAPFCGGWLQYLCNNTQHAGLRDKVPDYRLCCRTMYLNPVFRFLYWHMNYHTEHHMYAAVPCYNLGKLHRLIKDDLPPTPNGLLPAWRQIIQILRRQKQDPQYQYTAPLPQKSVAVSAA